MFRFFVEGVKKSFQEKSLVMNRTPWFQRKFPAIEDAGVFLSIVERLDGTPARLASKMLNQSTSVLEMKEEASQWSVKEEIGHLIDLEPLWLGRVEDLMEGKEELRNADLTNRKTHEANHNQRDIDQLLHEFRLERAKLLKCLQQVTEKDLERSSLHPRLKTPMKILDLAYFIAEHDDHHLAQITYLISIQHVAD